jgi:hypothetical protein
MQEPINRVRKLREGKMKSRSLISVAVVGVLVLFLGLPSSAQSATSSTKDVETLKKSVASLTASLNLAQRRIQALESKSGTTSGVPAKESQIIFISTPNIFGECPSGYRANILADRFYVASRDNDFGNFDSSRPLIECSIKVLTK